MINDLSYEENTLNMISKISNGIFYRFSNKQGGIFYTENVFNILGYKKEELLKNPNIWNNSILEEDKEKVLNIIENSENNKKQDKFENKIDFKKNKIKILLAEDNILNTKYLEKIFEKNGNYNVDYARNGKEALNYFKFNNYDVILMDINMPEMNGIEASEEIRKLDKKIPIIAMTAYIFEDEITKVLKTGINDYIFKPFLSKEIIEKINKFL